MNSTKSKETPNQILQNLKNEGVLNNSTSYISKVGFQKSMDAKNHVEQLKQQNNIK